MILSRFTGKPAAGAVTLAAVAAMAAAALIYPGAAVHAAEGAGDLFAGSDALREKAAASVRNMQAEPQWLDGGARLWLRATGPDGTAEFFLVDCTSGKREPLFNHEGLKAALRQAGAGDEAARLLRLDNVLPDAAARRTVFACGGKTWTWDDAAGVLKEGAGDSTEAGAPAAPVPRASRDGGAEMHLRIRNESGAAVKLWWINTRGQRQSYGGAAPGTAAVQHTFAGHVWVVTDDAGRDLAAFAADPGRAEVTVKEAQEIRWEERRRRGGPDRPRRQAQTSDQSPDGRFSAFIREHNLYLKGPDGKETALTADGTAEDGYEGPFFWSPDSARLAALRHRRVEERKVTAVRSSPEDQLQPKVESWDYAKPGDPLPWRRPRLFDTAKAEAFPADEALYSNAWSIGEFHWAPDSSAFHFLFNQRGHQLLRLVAMNAATGAASALFEEKAETFVDYSQKTFLHWLDGTGEFLWMSERDGWNHLYLCDARTGAVKNQITRGAWVVRSVERVDDERRQILFRCMGIHAGQDPYHMHYARVNFDGSGLTLLTEGDGTHRISFSPDGRTYTDTWSRTDHPPVHELRRTEDGKPLCELVRADASVLISSGWPVPQRFTAKGRDGATDIQGMILRPHAFDPARKYPVIEYIYAGPHDFFVPKDFRPWYRHWELGNLGFVLVFIDGMGTNWRSRAFHDTAWRNLGDAGYPDRIAWMKAAAAAHPELDLTRVGIFGGSAGGQNAMRALIAHGDFYHCAAADCGCHDNRMDKIWWNEAWMGWPVGPHYAEASNVDQAHRLRGHLLLTVGEMDHNVDPASTTQVVNALVKAGKDFEYLVIPGADHGAGESPYASRRRARFFMRHLLGIQPPPN